MAKRQSISFDLKFRPKNELAEFLCIFLTFPDIWLPRYRFKKHWKASDVVKGPRKTFKELTRALGKKDILIKRKCTKTGNIKYKLISDKNEAIATYFRINR